MVTIHDFQFELFAALTKNGMTPSQNKGVTIVQQDFTMNAFLNHQIDAASAMTYNELAQVLEAKNPKTGKLYQMSDLNVIKMQSVGTGMLEDGIFSTGKWLKDPANQATATKFIGASLAGWIYCRDHLAECTSIVLKNGPALPKGHQRWQMNEVNALIWPNKLGVGIMDPVEFKRTATIAKTYKVIKKPASKASYRTDLAKKAVANLRKQGLDVFGGQLPLGRHFHIAVLFQGPDERALPWLAGNDDGTCITPLEQRVT